MRVIIFLIFVLLIGCTDHNKLASDYELDLQYYQNSVSFSEKNMLNEAISSCEQTSVLRSECFTSLVQNMMGKGIHVEKKLCDEIKPEEKMQMSMKSFELVYDDIDEDLENELKEKRNPSELRIGKLKQIKEDCTVLSTYQE